MLRCSAPIIALHGFLGCPADWDGLEVNAITIPKTLDAITLPRGCILMGYSMGGRIAMQLAYKNPHHYRGLILIGAHPGLSAHEKASRLKFENAWLKIFQMQDYPKALNAWYSQPIFDHLRQSKNFQAILQRRQATPSPWQYMQTYSLYRQPIVTPKLPTLFIYGEHDQKYASIAQSFPHRLMVPGCGHAPHLENPERFSTLLNGCAQALFPE